MLLCFSSPQCFENDHLLWILVSSLLKQRSRLPFCCLFRGSFMWMVITSLFLSRALNQYYLKRMVSKSSLLFYSNDLILLDVKGLEQFLGFLLSLSILLQVYLGEQYVNNSTLSDVTFLVEGSKLVITSKFCCLYFYYVLQSLLKIHAALGWSQTLSVPISAWLKRPWVLSKQKKWNKESKVDNI